MNQNEAFDKVLKRLYALPIENSNLYNNVANLVWDAYYAGCEYEKSMNESFEETTKKE